MNEFYIRNVIEAALLAAGKPLQLAEIGQLFDENTRPKVDDLRAALDALAADYSSRGIELKETAAGFRIQVRREFSSEISRLWPERPAKYSRALLETLALIAYRQPITRAEIEAVRGVAVNPNIIKTVIERNWVRVVGHRDVPGRPELLGTTREFLDYFGLRSLDELPPLAELKAMGDYNLQLELPNGATGEGEPKALEGVASVAGLLTSDAAANTDDVSADANVAEADAADAGDASQISDANAEIGDEPVVVTTSSDSDADHSHDTAAHYHSTSDAVAHATVASNSEGSHEPGAHGHSSGDTAAHGAVDSNGEGAREVGAHDHSAGDTVAHSAVGSNSEGSREAGAHDHSAGDTVAHGAVDSNSEGAREAGAHDHSAGDTVAHGAVRSNSEGARKAGAHGHSAGDTVAHSAVGSNSEGAHEVGVHDHSAGDAVAHPTRDSAADAHLDAEAERTLAAGDVAKHSAVDSDDSDTSATTGSGESSDALDELADDDADDDELSADGHESRELVAAPPDLDD